VIETQAQRDKWLRSRERSRKALRTSLDKHFTGKRATEAESTKAKERAIVTKSPIKGERATGVKPTKGNERAVEPKPPNQSKRVTNVTNAAVTNKERQKRWRERNREENRKRQREWMRKRRAK
jgi:hypothetical protein